MIPAHIDSMIKLSEALKLAIVQDIEDVKKANHEKLLDRNAYKLELMHNINDAQEKLNQLLMEEMQNGIDVNIYRELVDDLEISLKELYELNGKLANIVLPVKEMYKQIIDEISQANGGNLVEVTA